MSEHTPMPWTVCGGTTPHFKAIHSIHGYIVFSMADVEYDEERGKAIFGPAQEEQEANADFIVRACNAHDLLIEAIEGLLWATQCPDDVEAVAAMEAMAKRAISSLSPTAEPLNNDHGKGAV